MAVREIVAVPQPVLRQKAKAVRQITPAIETLIDDMIETMREAPGVGLAAPQVGVGIQVIVVEFAEGSESDADAGADNPVDGGTQGSTGTQAGTSTQVGAGTRAGTSDPEEKPKLAKLYALVNPEITRHSKDLVAGNEGCLSIPGYMGEVERYSTATVKGLDRHGKPFKLKAKGWLARIFQHEIDHINGVLFIDRTEKIWKVEPEEEQEVSETV